jgi:predicted RND superfamily exporter protein
MNKIISKLYFNQILNNPKKVIVSLMAILAVMSLFITNFKLDASADSLILENDKDLMVYRDTVERYETKEFIVLTYTPKTGSVFDSKNLNLIQKLKSKLLKINGVNSIISLVDVPLVESSDIPIVELVNNVPNILSKEVDAEKAEEEIISSPIYKNLIISEDGKTTALQVTFKNNKELTELSKIKARLVTKELQDEISEEESMSLKKIKKEYEQLKYMHDENMHNMLIAMRLIKANFENSHDVEMRMGGIPMIADDMIGYVKSDLINFGVGVFIFIVATLIIIFRNLKWVILPLLSCAYAVIIMIGLLGLMNWQVTVISSNFISLMLILTLSMNIHLIVRYRQLCQLSSVTQYKLVCLTTEKMVWPCLYTALTTIVAFASLVFSDIKPVIDFGYMMVLGLSVTFLTSFLLLPCILCLLKKEVVQNNNENKEFKFTKSLADFTINNGRYVIGLSLSLLLITLFGISQLRVENSFINYFKSNTEIYKGMKQIDDKLGGTTPLDIIIKFEEKSKSLIEEDDFGYDLLDDEEPSDSEWFKVRKVDKIKLIHDYLDGLPEIGKVLSLVSTIRVAEKINDDNKLDSLEMALLYKRAPDEIKEMAVNPYVSIEKNEARISVRVLDSKDDLRRNELIKKINYDIEHKLGFKKESYFLTGILILYNNMLQSLFESQILSLGFVMLGITLMFMILFKSALLSFIGIIPNLLAATFVLGLMGLIKLPLDMMTITIAAITIGIAVDNSIHYIYRFREEFYLTKNYETALYNSHDSIGRAIFFTSITIIFGFSILVLSNFIPTIIFGLLIGLAMMIALLAVLTLLPKLILSFRPF